MSNTSLFSNQYGSRTMKTLFLALIIMMTAMVASAAAPIGQTIWIRSSGTNLFVSADQARGAFAPLVADRTAVAGWEQFQVIDAGGGFIALRSIGNGRFVSADLDRGAWAPLVADRTSASTWEHFIWADLPGGAFTLRGRVTNRFVCADQNRGAFAPLVSDRVAASAWETFTWAAVGGTPPPPPPHRHRLRQQERLRVFQTYFGLTSSTGRQSAALIGLTIWATAGSVTMNCRIIPIAR